MKQDILECFGFDKEDVEDFYFNYHKYFDDSQGCYILNSKTIKDLSLRRHYNKYLIAWYHVKHLKEYGDRFEHKKFNKLRREMEKSLVKHFIELSSKD